MHIPKIGVDLKIPFTVYNYPEKMFAFLLQGVERSPKVEFRNF
jgi:hypothetical protein